ncbi:hypothetical protein ACOJBO_09205 [Rhizobium beringeri]
MKAPPHDGNRAVAEKRFYEVFVVIVEIHFRLSIPVTIHAFM